jgi:hypothetical protein
MRYWREALNSICMDGVQERGDMLLLGRVCDLFCDFFVVSVSIYI